MSLDKKNIHSVVHHKDKLFTALDYPRNFGNAAKPVGRCTILQIQILGILYPNVPSDPVGHTSYSQPLPPVPMAPHSIQKMRDWAKTKMARAGTPPSYHYQRVIQPGEPVSLERSDFEEQQ